ncbi:hypothetical protein P7K49_036864 [Saguinus oedipus]|uniref:Uncharacterized protein n=1 Tax=Saguinus oedipus TaxID=9490 RepID=A0ABQ9TLC5_SAGOE|nr:hypothetical protein P7K49_036864 [Saguinus oedipus]
MTAEPSSRTRLYAARQASLSILVAIAAGPQRGHCPGRPSAPLASGGDGSAAGTRRGRTGGRRWRRRHGAFKLRARRRRLPLRTERAPGPQAAARPAPPRAHWPLRPRPASSLAAGLRGRSVLILRRPIPAPEACATPRWGPE